MLEPETDDNVIYWNTMDAWLPRPDRRVATGGGFGGGRGNFDVGGDQQDGPPLVPIYKLMRPAALTSTVVETPR